MGFRVGKVANNPHKRLQAPNWVPDDFKRSTCTLFITENALDLVGMKFSTVSGHCQVVNAQVFTPVVSLPQ